MMHTSDAAGQGWFGIELLTQFPIHLPADWSMVATKMTLRLGEIEGIQSAMSWGAA